MTGHASTSRVRLWFARRFYRLAYRLAREPDPIRICEPVYRQPIDTWTYPVSFTSTYRTMALEGFVGICKLVQLGDGGWTIEVQELDLLKEGPRVA